MPRRHAGEVRTMTEMSKARAEVFRSQIWGDELRTTRNGYQWTAIPLTFEHAKQIIDALEKYREECRQQDGPKWAAMRGKLR